MRPDRCKSDRFILTDETFWGLAGNDEIFSYGGDEPVYGDEGNDTVFAGTGNDRVEGGEGDDNINGGQGNANLTGSAKADTFWLDHLNGWARIPLPTFRTAST